MTYVVLRDCFGDSYLGDGGIIIYIPRSDWKVTVISISSPLVLTEALIVSDATQSRSLKALPIFDPLLDDVKDSGRETSPKNFLNSLQIDL